MAGEFVVGNMVNTKFKPVPLGKPAKRLNTARTRGTRGQKTVTVEVPLKIEHEIEVDPILALGEGGLPQQLQTAKCKEGTTTTPDADMEHDHIPTVSKHHQKRIQTANKWTTLRKGLADRLIMDSYPSTFTCCVCKHTPLEAKIYRCADCGPMSYFCKECCTNQHQSSLHSIQVWSEEHHFFQEYWLPTTWTTCCENECRNTYAALIVVIDDRGHQRLQKMEFCSCEDRAVTLLGYGLWPASPDIPTIAFTLDLMLTLRTLVLEGQIPLTAFCHGMQRHRIHMKVPDWVADISRVLRWEVLLNFMNVYHQTKFLQIAANIYNPLLCMACPKEDSERGKILCMDGNFRLVHRRAAGGPALDVRHHDSFFLPQAEVDAFVSENNAKRKPHTKTCSNFQADSVIRTKNKTEKLDVTGVFGSVCNHNFPQKFLDMRFGERMAYPIFLMSNIKNIKILLYDIGCQLEAHLVRNNIDYGYKIGVPALHVYGHQRSCQLTYSPRTLEGAGLCDGEGTERLWSFLGRFATISKEMTLENRADILTEALLHYGNRITLRLGIILCQRLEKAYMLRDSTHKTLQDLMTQHQGTTLHIFSCWTMSERAEKRKKQPVQVDWRMDYALTLFDFYEEMHQVQPQAGEVDHENVDGPSEDLERLESRLLRQERRRNMNRWPSDSEEYMRNLNLACERKRPERLEEVRDNAVEYTHMAQLRPKYSKGQALAHRIAIQTQKASKKLTDSIAKFNTLPCHGSETIPHRIKRTDVLPMDSSPIWVSIDENDTEGPFITGSEKRKCIDSYRLHQRSKEEIKRTLGDMIVLIENIEERLLSIKRILLENSAIQKPTALDLAIRAELNKHLIDCNDEFETVSELYRRSSRPHVVDMVALIESIEEKLATRVLPKEQEGLSTEAISDVLADVVKIEDEFDSHEEDQDSSDVCER